MKWQRYFVVFSIIEFATIYMVFKDMYLVGLPDLWHWYQHKFQQTPCYLACTTWPKSESGTNSQRKSNVRPVTKVKSCLKVELLKEWKVI